MGLLTISAAGQSLTVDIQTPAGHEQPVYTDATHGTPITLPLSITADQDFYLPAGTNEITVTVTTAAGVEILNETVIVGDTTHAVLYPRPSSDQAAATDSAAPTGGSTPVGVYLTCDLNVTIASGAGTDVPFNHMYDNPLPAQALITQIPAGLGLSFAFDGSSPTFTCVEDGVWSYQIGCYPNTDDTGALYLGLRAVDSIDFYVPDLSAAYWKPGWVAVQGASSFEAPAGSQFTVFAALQAATTVTPYICNSWTAAFQRVR